MYKLVLLVSILLLVIIVYNKSPEHFSNIDKTENEENKDKKKVKRIVCNIIPGFNNNYIGTFLPEEDTSNNTLITTRSLESNKWEGPIKNGAVDKKSIIVDLNYDQQKRLLCVAINVNDGNSIFKIYRKETSDITSKWEELPSDKQIRSLMFDTDNKLMGCGDDGQIYKKYTEDYTLPEWDGPINYDIPMKKIFFDKDLYLLGIGLEDGKLYKKRGFFWSEDKWDSLHVNDESIYDAFHDLDGRKIATSHRGILKQKNADFMSNFILLNEYPKDKTKKILNKNDVLMFRTGLRDLTIEKIVENENDKSIVLEEPLQRILDFKKNAKKVCKNKHNYMSQKVSDNYSNILLVNKQAKTIDNLENLISQYEAGLDYRVGVDVEEEK